MEFWTIGHSSLKIEEFTSLLKHHEIDALIDVRSYPSSTYCPQFNKDRMKDSLELAGVRYQHISILGGRRSKQKGVEPDLNSGWNNPSFKNYADYTLSKGYEEGIESLIGMAGDKRIAFCCSESCPWRCHRLLVSNTLAAREHRVNHIMGMKIKPHLLGEWGAKPSVSAGNVFYPGIQLSMFGG